MNDLTLDCENVINCHFTTSHHYEKCVLKEAIVRQWYQKQPMVHSLHNLNYHIIYDSYEIVNFGFFSNVKFFYFLNITHFQPLSNISLMHIYTFFMMEAFRLDAITSLHALHLFRNLCCAKKWVYYPITLLQNTIRT